MSGIENAARVSVFRQRFQFLLILKREKKQSERENDESRRNYIEFDYVVQANVCRQRGKCRGSGVRESPGLVRSREQPGE